MQSIKWEEQKNSWRDTTKMKERDKELKEKLRHRQVKQDLRIRVARHARLVYREIKISFLFHYFISCKEEYIKNLVKQFANFQKFDKLVRNMDEEKLKKTECELQILEEKIKNIKKIEKIKTEIKNKEVSPKLRKKKDAKKKNIEENHCPFEHITKATPRLKVRNKLLNMATG